MAGIEAHYISQNSFWIYTDRTSEFVYGRRLKANCGSDGYKYTTISGSSFSHPKTTVTVLDNVLTNNLSEVWYGISVGSEGSLPVHKHTSQSDGGLFYIPGLQKLTYEYTTSSGIKICPGCICIDTGSEKITLVNSNDLFIDVDISSSGIRYLYVDPSTANINSDSIKVSSSAPQKVLTRYGHYHPSNTSWRCFGAFLIRDDVVRKFYISGSRLFWSQDFNDEDSSPIKPSNNWTDNSIQVPLFDDVNFAMLTFRFGYIDGSGWALARKKGDSGNGYRLQMINSDNKEVNALIDMPCDNNGYIQVKFDTTSSNNNEIRIFNRGFILPYFIAPN